MKPWMGCSLMMLGLACGSGSDGDDPGTTAQLCPGVVSGASSGAHRVRNAWTVSTSRSSLNAAPAPAAPAPTESVLVQLKAGRVGAQALSAHAGLRRRTLRQGRVHVLEVNAAQRAALEADPDVERVEPNHKVHALAFPFTPVQQGSVGEYTPGLAAVQAPAVWDRDRNGVLDEGAFTGAGIKICIIDSGLDLTHPELKLPFLAGKDFIDNDDDVSDGKDTLRGTGHGTHVAGTIAAQLSSAGAVPALVDASGVVGVAPGASLLIARVLDVFGEGDVSDVIAGLEWCQTQGARIVTLSLGSGEASAIEKAAFDAAAAAGVLSFAATGNGGSDKPMGYPAGYASVISVGAVDNSLVLAEFSQTGFDNSSVDLTARREGVVAPGVNVLSTALMGAEAEARTFLDGAAVVTATVEYSPLVAYEAPVVDCGKGEGKYSCKERSCTGFIAYVDRGPGPNGKELTFAQKVHNVLLQGAGAVIIGNNDGNEAQGNFTLGGERDELDANAPRDWPTVVSVDLATGMRIKEQAGLTARMEFSRFDYRRMDGTSMATPHASAVAALIWSKNLNLKACQVKQQLFLGAHDLGASGFDARYGYGLVQAKASLDLPTPAPCTP